MGQHIVPQHLLRRISPDGKNIWQYDKESVVTTPLKLPILKVSQTRKIFSGDVEKLLSTIEGAASPVLDKLTQGQLIDPIERRVMAVYLEMYLVRNREQRKKFKREFLGDREKIERFMDAEMECMRGTNFHTEYAELKMNFVEDYESDLARKLRGVWAPSNFIRWLFLHMTWCVAESEATEFVIGEPPLASAGGIGLGHPDAEFFFPLSSNHILHMSWVGNPAIIEKVSISRSAAQQANKVFISNSSRFVFFDKNCSKMARLIKKRNFSDNDIELNWVVTGDNPYRPKQPWIVTDEDWDRFDMMICMHPAASNFKHAWSKAGNHQIIHGGKLVKWCRHCRLEILKYGGKEELICNNEVALATGKFKPYRNWWMGL